MSRLRNLLVHATALLAVSPLNAADRIMRPDSGVIDELQFWDKVNHVTTDKLAGKH